jgi:hypothetical protein
MKNDRDQDDHDTYDEDETEFDAYDDAVNDAVELSDDEAVADDAVADDAAASERTDTDDDEDAIDVPAASAATSGDWDDFQFDSPELAAYASYAAYAEELASGNQAADADINETVETIDATEIAEIEDIEDTERDEIPDYASQPDALVLDPSLDIDAALAAVGTLPDLMAERDAAYEIEQQRQQEITRASDARERWRQGYRFARPPQMRLQRGQPASVIPALILIAVGAYLTFALNLSQTPPARGIVVLLVCGAVGVTLLSYWLNARRWARGALFGGLLLILFGLAFYFITTPSLAVVLPAGLLAGGGWRLLIGAAFAALTLSGLLARPASAGLTVLGLGGVLGIVAILLIDTGALASLNTTLSVLLTEGWKIVLPLVALLLVLGLFQRVRQRRQFVKTALPEAEIPAA